MVCNVMIKFYQVHQCEVWTETEILAMLILLSQLQQIVYSVKKDASVGLSVLEPLPLV